MLNNNYEDFPPYPYLKQVGEHCPKAVCTYMDIWKDRDKANKLKLYKDQVRNKYLISLAKFRHDLLLLVKEGLISIDETDQSLSIELIGWE